MSFQCGVTMSLGFGGRVPESERLEEGFRKARLGVRHCRPSCLFSGSHTAINFRVIATSEKSPTNAVRDTWKSSH